MKLQEMLAFGAIAGSKIVISAPILNYYNRNIPKKKKKKIWHPPFFTPLKLFKTSI